VLVETTVCVARLTAALFLTSQTAKRSSGMPPCRQPSGSAAGPQL